MSIIISSERIKERQKKLTQTNVSVAFPIFIFGIWHTFGEQGEGRGEGGAQPLNCLQRTRREPWQPPGPKLFSVVSFSDRLKVASMHVHQHHLLVSRWP